MSLNTEIRQKYQELGFLGQSKFQCKEPINQFHIEESTKNKKLYTETLKQEIKSSVRDKCELENRNMSKFTAVLWHFRTIKTPTQETKSITF